MNLKKEKMMVRMSSFGILTVIMLLMMVAYITLQEGFQVHFQSLAEEMVLGVAPAVAALSMVFQAEVGKH